MKRFALLILLSVMAFPVLAAPKSELWEDWLPHDPASTTVIDHSAWQAFLDRYVELGEDGVVRVAYGRILAPHRAELDEYIAMLASIQVSRLNRDEQMPYWINFYNALTVRVIHDHYPVDSIRDVDISPGLFSNGPWGKKLLEVEGREVSLDDIEHRILRPIWNEDPRIHYVVNCAAIGCPNLSPTAYTSDGLQDQLDASARAFLNHPRGFRIDDRGRAIGTKLFDWYADDFGANEAEILDHVRQYAEGEQLQRLEGVTEFDSYEYDWDLNVLN